MFEEGKYKLSQGKIQNLHGDEVIVNHTFAEVNGLAIGDILTIKEDIVVKIVGIFMSNDEENQPKMIASKIE